MEPENGSLFFSVGHWYTEIDDCCVSIGANLYQSLVTLYPVQNDSIVKQIVDEHQRNNPSDLDKTSSHKDV
jgi:hypothetical protein